MRWIWILEISSKERAIELIEDIRFLSETNYEIVKAVRMNVAHALFDFNVFR